MPLREVVSILPCSSLGDLPTWHAREPSAELLTAWTLGWHPWLLAQSGKLPSWKPASTAADAFHECVVLLPSLSREQVPAGWGERLDADGFDTPVITSLENRQAAVDQVFASLADLDVAVPTSESPLVEELAADFFALGYASLVVELLGHLMHYSSNVDRHGLETAAVAAARAAVAGDRSVAEERLQRGFDLLAEARDYYYPVDSYMLDVTLIAPSVWGSPLADRLGREPGTTVLLSAADVGRLAHQAPDSVRALRAAMEERRVTLIGGDLGESDLSELSLEALLEELSAARRIYKEHLNRPPEIFGRFRGGFSPLLPCVLDGLGFRGALLATFDGSPVPSADQCRFRWEGADGTAIDTLGLAPNDAGDPCSLLQLAERLSHSMQHDHVATVLFASWPGCESPFYLDLQRAAKRCPTLGRFVTLQQYLDETHGGDLPASFDADAFLAGVDKQGLAAPSPSALSTGAVRQYERERSRLLSGLADVVSGASPSPGDATGVAQSLERLGNAVRGAASPPRDDRPQTILTVNLTNHTRTLCFAIPGGPSQPASRPRPASTLETAPEAFAKDVPPLGFVWQPLSVTASPPAPLAQGLVLRNEHFEVNINRHSGGIGAVHDYRRRHNRLSQQLACRLRTRGRCVSGEADESAYTRMIAEDVRITAATPACGEISSTGRLQDGRGTTVARFRQVTRLCRGSRLIELSTEFFPDDRSVEVGRDKYFAVRWAWRDEPLDVRRGIHGASFLTKRKDFVAAFVELQEGEGRFVVLSSERERYVRPQENRLDCVAGPSAEGGYRLEVAIGLDLEGAAGHWADWYLPPVVAPVAGDPPLDRAWWLLCGSTSVRWTALRPLLDGRQGFVARLQEMSGRYVKTTVQAFRPIRSARRTDLRGTPHIELPVHDGRIELQMAGYQWIQIEAEWE